MLAIQLIVLMASVAHAIDVETLARLNSLQDSLNNLAKQTMIQQEFIEERIRTDGQSGLKQLRLDSGGTKNYYSPTHIDFSVGSIHDHSDYNRVMGMGEMSAVLNGVEFRTRHNDYRLVRPSTTNTTFGAVEDIPYPEVPPEVTRLATVEEQIVEMKQWFKAFARQNVTLRDYRNYFKPAICYLEGMWTTDPTTIITEPFKSDRHRMNAKSWDELMQKIRYMSYTGIKDNFENAGFLPRKIMYLNPTTGEPVYGQWNYRILCNPINADIPISFLKRREDWSWNTAYDYDLPEVPLTRGARYELNENGDDESFTTFTLLDKIMQEVPGLDNVPNVNLTENYQGTLYAGDSTTKPLRASNYHRWYNFASKGAMGTKLTHRGYSDPYLFVAVNTRPNVVPMSVQNCVNGVCNTYSTRVSYAVPLEVVYLTPLLNWNPYNIAYNEDPDITYGGDLNLDGETVLTAFNGANFETYYRTPVNFFNGSSVLADLADTVTPVVKMKNKLGKVVDVTATGTRIMLPKIDGVGEVRLRYPIHPIHGEGSSVWKEVNAIKTFLTT